MSLVLVRRSGQPAVLLGEPEGLDAGEEGQVEETLAADVLLGGLAIRDWPMGVTRVPAAVADRFLQSLGGA